MSVQCIRLLGFSFFGTEIAIGIEIESISRGVLPYGMTYSFDFDSYPGFDLDYPNKILLILVRGTGLFMLRSAIF